MYPLIETKLTCFKCFLSQKSFFHICFQREEAEWVGLSIKEALEKAETELAEQDVQPLKQTYERHLRKTYRSESFYYSSARKT